MKTIKSYSEFGSSKISKVQNFLDQTIFKRGCCQKLYKNKKNPSGMQNVPICYKI